jgi:hypothetical protein
MFKFRPTCLDIILFSGFAYAISDSIKNWTDYKECELPLHVWLTTSVISMLLIRILHFFGQVLSGIEEAIEPENAEDD